MKGVFRTISLDTRVPIMKRVCVNVRREPHQDFIEAMPNHAQFDIEECEGCAFWWLCQAINNKKGGD